MSDRIDQLERLQRLRESGAIDENEYEHEKGRLLHGQTTSSKRQLRVAALVSVAVILAACFLAIGWAMVPRGEEPQAETRHVEAIPQVAAPAAARAGNSPHERLALAVRAAFPTGTNVRDEEVQFAFVNHHLVDAPFGPVLVSEGQARDASHVTSGRLAVFYLRESGVGFTVVRRFPKAVEVGSFGRMSEWSISNRFSDLPVLYASGGFTGQGITEGCSVLTELRPDGPQELVAIPDAYSDAGALRDNNQPPQDIEGRITRIVRGSSFDVAYSGSRTATLRYVRRGDRFVRQGQPILDHCGE
jgi:hypothetical protein